MSLAARHQAWSFAHHGWRDKRGSTACSSPPGEEPRRLLASHMTDAVLNVHRGWSHGRCLDHVKSPCRVESLVACRHWCVTHLPSFESRLPCLPRYVGSSAQLIFSVQPSQSPTPGVDHRALVTPGHRINMAEEAAVGMSKPAFPRHFDPLTTASSRLLARQS